MRFNAVEPHSPVEGDLSQRYGRAWFQILLVFRISWRLAAKNRSPSFG